jgi:hypothetical protein
VLITGLDAPAGRRSRSSIAFVAAMMLSGIGMLTACGPGDGSASSTADSGASGATAPDAAMPAEAMMDESGKVAAPVDRQVIVTASMSVRVDDVKGQTARVSSLVTAAGGLVQQQDMSMSDGLPYANITVRVPADQLDQLITDVSALGSVEYLTTQAADVTQQTVDLEARIGALTTSVQRLKVLLATASNVADLVAVETELANRQAELDSLTSQRDYLADQVAMSTLTVSLSPVVEVGSSSAPGFWPGLQNGLNAFAALVAGSITALGFLLPFIAAAAIVVLIILGIIHLLTRRRRGRVENRSPEVSEATEAK